MLDSRQRQTLLAVARQSIREALGGAAEDAASPSPITAAYGGIFVTLERRGELRGCIGSFRDIEELVQATREAARATLSDPRFGHDPVTAAELPDLTVEISLLSARVLMESLDELTLGEHGIIVRYGDRSGCFLPKVAGQRAWNAEQFLANCCIMKAGLPADAWRRDGAEVWLFTAEVFSDRAPDRLE
ncbi:MAG: AmmeMemoRadiSam system protein A [Phycisphaerales bacterium]|nr:MAG: AmmeMemoRadiSam system protein A [Phycisphaerales bacterium]